MSIGGSVGCAVENSRGRTRKRSRGSGWIDEPEPRIGSFPDWDEGIHHTRPLRLPEPDETRGIGDILRGIMPDPDSDPVDQVRELRRSR